MSQTLPVPPDTQTAESAATGLYAAAWRWHFIAALFVTPFILVFAVTGSIYLFKPQIEGQLYHDLFTVSPAGPPISADAQLRAALDRFPGSTTQAYIPPHAPNQSTLVRIITQGHREITVAVNPYTGSVLGSIDDRNRPMQVVRELHGKLLWGKTGQTIQELAASWALVLILSGLYLWWPRRAAPVWGLFLPRLRTPGRIMWRDLHSVTGFWISGLLIFLILTGLPWSVVSGELIHRAAAGIGKGAPDTGLGWDGGGSRTVKSNPLQDDWITTHALQVAGPSVSTGQTNARPLSLSQILTIAKHLPGLQGPFEVRMPVDRNGVYTLLTDHESDPSRITYIHLDQYSGKTVKEVRWKDFGPLAKAISIGVALHEGRYFGFPNQILCLAACLGLILMVAAGLAMWWHRRPTGGLGIPALPEGFRPPPAVILIIMLLAVLMPLMGLALLLMVGGEWLAGLLKKHPAGRGHLKVL